MKIEKHHYTNYLISVHFSRNFTPDTMYGKEQLCLDFLDDLGSLARKSGMRLHANYSIVRGQNDYHAHFGVSWLPTYKRKSKVAKTKGNRINRHPIINMLEDNLFFVDSPKDAIKVVTHDKPYVTAYILEQPKDHQFAMMTGFYIHPDFIPTYSEYKARSYCSRGQFEYQENTSRKPINKILLISLAILLLISFFHLSLF